MEAAVPGRSPEFSGTGPQGHRARMRGRLLARAAALADYEVLEMLLFLGIPRRDTKPQAKGLIQRFGSLRTALTAGSVSLQDAGLPSRAASVLDLVVESAAQLARAERRDRVRLGGWEELDRFLLAPDRPRRHGLTALLLNNRNQLLAECRCDAADPPGVAAVLLRHALARDATAVILVRAAATARTMPGDTALFEHCREAASSLSIAVHDLVVTGDGPDWVSLRAPVR